VDLCLCDADYVRQDVQLALPPSMFAAGGAEAPTGASEYRSGRNRLGVQGAHLNPLGLFLEPPGHLLTHLHTVYIA
jgi:hypothetical protein